MLLFTRQDFSIWNSLSRFAECDMANTQIFNRKRESEAEIEYELMFLRFDKV
jgi:hypothetical protein